MNWNIKGCSEKCLKCQKEFIDKDLYHCRLFLEVEGPRREDYCNACWAALESNNISQGYSYWKGSFKAKHEPVEEKIEEPLLKRLLKKWIDSEERLHQCFCYILALMLQRNKTFIPKPSVKNPEGREQLVYEDRDNGETYILGDPGLTLKELDEIEKDLQEMLKQELVQ